MDKHEMRNSMPMGQTELLFNGKHLELNTNI